MSVQACCPRGALWLCQPFSCVLPSSTSAPPFTVPAHRLQAKEQLEIQAESVTLASVSYQAFFR